MPCGSFSEMMTQVRDGNAQMAMVPVENSTAGRVADIHHLLPESGLKIAREHFQPVNHQLLVLKVPHCLTLHMHIVMNRRLHNVATALNHILSKLSPMQIQQVPRKILREHKIRHRPPLPLVWQARFMNLSYWPKILKIWYQIPQDFLLMAPDAPIATYDPAKKYVTTMVFQCDLYQRPYIRHLAVLRPMV